MNITELDEWQGLTAEMVREWLVANGWQRMPAQDMPRSECWVRNGGAGGTIWVGVDSPADKTLSKIAKWMECSVQSLLREINPRMRKGMPSEAAKDAHPGGLWLATPDFACIGAHVPVVVTFDGDGFGVWHPEGFALPDSKPKTVALWHFWPCDANGNKTRWPTDAEGRML